jgi:hypothetical protein
MDPSSNVSVSFDPSEIEAILNQSAQQTPPLQQVAPQSQEASQQEQPSPFGPLSTLASNALDLGKGVASVLDNTVGGILPYFAKQATYAGGRAFGQTPEEAEQTSNQAAGYFNQPFGSALGVTQDPAYTNEATSQLMNYVGQNIGQGSQWISNQTGLPVQDVENMMNTMLGASGEIAGPVAKTVAKEAANKAFMGESLVPKSLQQFLPEVSALGIMEGRSSRNWSSKAENDFLNNEQKGISPHANLAMTGVLRGPDNMLRQQISDKGAQVKLDESLIPRKDLTLEDVYDHPKLYDSYPWLKNVPVIFREDLPDRSMGGYSPTSNHIYLNAKHINNATEMKKTFGHEVSHIIQQAEGFGRGGNEAMFPVLQDIADAKEIETYMSAANVSAKDAADLFQATHKRRPSDVAINYANSGQGSMVPYISPTKRYEHILGEIDARLSENRMGLSDAELRQYYPYEYNPQNFSSGIPEKKNYGIENDIDLNHALIHSGYDAKGKHIFMTAPEWRRVQASREKLAAREVSPTPEGHKKGGMIEHKITPDYMKFELAMRK